MADDDDSNELEPVQEPEDGDSCLEQADDEDPIQFNGDLAPASAEIIYAECDGDDIHLPHDGADPTAADDHAVSEVWPEQQFDYSPRIQIEEGPCRPERISSPIQPPEAADNVSKAYPIADMADNEPEGNVTGRLPQRRTRTKRYVSDLHVCNCGEAVADGDESIIECNRAGCETRKVSRIIDTKFNALTNSFYNLVPPNLRKPRVCRSRVDL